jgi:hypothetical protein
MVDAKHAHASVKEALLLAHRPAGVRLRAATDMPSENPSAGENVGGQMPSVSYELPKRV